MSVIRFELLNKGRSSTRDWRSRRKRKLVYDVYTNDVADGCQVVEDFMFSVFPPVYVLGNDVDPFCYFKGITVEPCSTDDHWHVTIDYDSDLDYPESGNGSGPPNTFPTDPTARAPIVKYSDRKVQIAVLFDVNGVPLLNAAGSPFDPPEMKEIPVQQIKITLNRGFDNPDLKQDYTNTVNAGPITIRDKVYPEGAIKMVSLEFDPKFEQFQFYEWQYIFERAPLEWPWNGSWLTKQILNAGCWQLDASGNQIVCTDQNGAPATSPVPLFWMVHKYQTQHLTM